jgi:hypothetical protein
MMPYRAPIAALLLVMTPFVADSAARMQAGTRPGNRRPVLWTDPGEIAKRDLLWGPGSAERAPKPPFTFVKEDTDGTQPKVHVRDGAGREWTVKLGEEVHAGIAASRIVWALGYVADEIYYVDKGTITGLRGLTQAAEAFSTDGSFSKASFRLRDARAERAEQRWTFEKNPFVGTKELSGLAMLMTMICNWDIQGTRNNRSLEIAAEDHYAVTDLGASFGKMGAFPVPRSKWNLADFQKEEFIEGSDATSIDLDYEGYAGINKVPMEHARWFAGLASQLTDDHLRAAFHAAGASQAEIDGFAARMRQKITELQKAVGSRY